jgi:hypothetical protein
MFGARQYLLLIICLLFFGLGLVTAQAGLGRLMGDQIPQRALAVALRPGEVVLTLAGQDVVLRLNQEMVQPVLGLFGR